MIEIFIDIVEGSNNTITVTENDNLTETYKLILMKNRIRINLTNKKVKFVFVKSNSNNGDIFDEMNISNPAEGEVELPITNKITKDNGLYSCGLAIYNNQGYLEHTGIFNLYVKENLFEKVSNELIEHNTYKTLISLLDKASDMNSKLVTNTSEANKVNNTAINLRNALEGEVNRANQVNDTLTKTNSAAVDKNTTLNNSLEEAKKLLTSVGKYNLDNYMRKVDIPSDRDCNSFKEINVFCVFDTGAGDFKNTPEGTLPKGSCRVFIIINRGFTPTRFQQEFINLYPENRVTRHIRNFNADGNGNYGTWYKVYDEANKPTPNDIGTYTKDEIDSKDTTTLNSAKSYADAKKNEAVSFATTELAKKLNLTGGVMTESIVIVNDKGYRSKNNNGTPVDLVRLNNLNQLVLGYMGMNQPVKVYKDSVAYDVYHTGNKPTANDVGARPSNWLPTWNDIQNKPNTFVPGSHNHNDLYYTKEEIDNKDTTTLNSAKAYADEKFKVKDATTFMQQTDYVAVRTPTRKRGQYYEFWDTDNSWADIRCGELYANGYSKVYHTGNKPTPNDIGAVPFSNNSAMTIHADADGSSQEEYLSLQAGKNDLRVLSSAASQSADALLFNGNKIYHEGHKPTPSDIGALGKTEKAESAKNADKLNDMTFAWQYGSGNPTHIWGSQANGTYMQVWDPKNITVGRATNSNSADSIEWNNIKNKPSSFPPSEHNHDDLYFRKGSWNTNGEQDLLVHGKRALVGTPEGNLYLGYGGDFTALYFGWNKIYHQGFKPTPADIGASPSDHNHDDRYLKKEVGATNESLRFRTKFLEFGVDDSRLGELGVGPTDTYIHNTKSNKYLALKDDGRLFYNNKEVCDRGHFTGDPGLNGYQMFPSGLLVQWGYVDMGKDTTKLVNFQKSFKDNNYNLQVSVYGGPGRVPAVKTYYAKNNNFYIQCEAGFCVYWEAKGSV